MVLLMLNFKKLIVHDYAQETEQKKYTSHTAVLYRWEKMLHGFGPA